MARELAASVESNVEAMRWLLNLTEGKDMDAHILPASQVDFEKLFAYSADMLGTSQACKLLLAAWLVHLQKSSWVAFDNMKI